MAKPSRHIGVGGTAKDIAKTAQPSTVNARASVFTPRGDPCTPPAMPPPPHAAPAPAPPPPPPERGAPRRFWPCRRTKHRNNEHNPRFSCSVAEHKTKTTNTTGTRNGSLGKQASAPSPRQNRQTCQHATNMREQNIAEAPTPTPQQTKTPRAPRAHPRAPPPPRGRPAPSRSLRRLRPQALRDAPAYPLPPTGPLEGPEGRSELRLQPRLSGPPLGGHRAHPRQQGRERQGRGVLRGQVFLAEEGSRLRVVLCGACVVVGGEGGGGLGGLLSLEVSLECPADRTA